MIGEMDYQLQRYYVPTDDDIRFICSLYKVGDLIRFKREIRKSKNGIIRIETSSGEYIMRFFSAEPDRIEYINKVISKLKSSGLPVLVPLQTCKGSQYTHIRRDVAVQLSEYVDAIKSDHSAAQFYHCGRILRCFHDILSGMENGPGPKTSIYPSSENLIEGLTRLHKMRDLITGDKILIVEKCFDLVGYNSDQPCSNLPTTIIHGDWSPKNLLYGINGDIRCILDFDFIQRAERIFDVAYFLWYGQKCSYSIDAIRAFIGGYGSISQEEKAIIPFIMAKICLFFICSSAMTENPNSFLEEQIKSNYHMINRLQSTEGKLEIYSLF